MMLWVAGGVTRGALCCFPAVPPPLLCSFAWCLPVVNTLSYVDFVLFIRAGVLHTMPVAPVV